MVIEKYEKSVKMNAQTSLIAVYILGPDHIPIMVHDSFHQFNFEAFYIFIFSLENETLPRLIPNIMTPKSL